MAFLPTSPVTLEGGCMCKAVRYTVKIPALEERPISAKAVTYHHGKKLDGPTRMPFVTIDHCESCRLSCGGLVQSWMILPQPWVIFRLKGSNQMEEYTTKDVIMPSKEVLGNTTVRSYKSSDDVHRTFCGTCGSTLTYSFDGNETSPYGPILDLTVGTLDRTSLESEGFRVDRQGWWDDGISWIRDMLRNGDDGIVCNKETVTGPIVEGV
ncbi:hypothetical protein BDZ85DRAFT_255081 [Elsinoe ampelina]|uniref:CENP-V/GFA domain-containing protein n=1 Tax=Elsinoe ampelina TaxID=302913 RepID=A0A6A6GQ82_9PEZI|nr:hypothetical protein BDZ85DRAFT_255081 [Elsinoe ampelina]